VREIGWPGAKRSAQMGDRVTGPATNGSARRWVGGSDVPQIPDGERQRVATTSGGRFGERLPDGWATQREVRKKGSKVSDYS
jgi:hypothetical protein